MQKVMVVTGASDGIGAAAARRLSGDGHQVVVVGRSPAKTAAVAAELGAAHIVADFARLDDVRALADRLLSEYPRIDVLANNAGLMAGSRRNLTVDGHELTFQVNYLAPFLLTRLLLDRLVASHATVVATCSLAHRWGRLRLDDLDHSHSYTPFRAYGDSKLAQLLHVRELHRRYSASGLASAAYHPGTVGSNFSADQRSLVGLAYRGPLPRLVLTRPAQAADTLVFLAEGSAGTDFPSGEYFVKRKVARANPRAADPALAAALWERSDALVAG